MGARLPLDSRKLEPYQYCPKHWQPILLPASATTCKTAVNSDLIFLPDSLSKRVFLADSGASLSIVPYKSQAHPFGPTLRSTRGASISAWCYKTLQVKFGKTRFNYRFLLADVANPILGMDFFMKFNLLICPPPHPLGPVCLVPGQHPPDRYPTGPPQPVLQQLRLVLQRVRPLAASQLPSKWTLQPRHHR